MKLRDAGIAIGAAVAIAASAFGISTLDDVGTSSPTPVATIISDTATPPFSPKAEYPASIVFPLGVSPLSIPANIDVVVHADVVESLNFAHLLDMYIPPHATSPTAGGMDVGPDAASGSLRYRNDPTVDEVIRAISPQSAQYTEKAVWRFPAGLHVFPSIEFKPGKHPEYYAEGNWWGMTWLDYQETYEMLQRVGSYPLNSPIPTDPWLWGPGHPFWPAWPDDVVCPRGTCVSKDAQHIFYKNAMVGPILRTIHRNGGDEFVGRYLFPFMYDLLYDPNTDTTFVVSGKGATWSPDGYLWSQPAAETNFFYIQLKAKLAQGAPDWDVHKVKAAYLESVEDRNTIRADNPDPENPELSLLTEDKTGWTCYQAYSKAFFRTRCDQMRQVWGDEYYYAHSAWDILSEPVATEAPAAIGHWCAKTIDYLWEITQNLVINAPDDPSIYAIEQLRPRGFEVPKGSAKSERNFVTNRTFVHTDLEGKLDHDLMPDRVKERLVEINDEWVTVWLRYTTNHENFIYDPTSDPYPPEDEYDVWYWSHAVLYEMERWVVENGREGNWRMWATNDHWYPMDFKQAFGVRDNVYYKVYNPPKGDWLLAWNSIPSSGVPAQIMAQHGYKTIPEYLESSRGFGHVGGPFSGVGEYGSIASPPSDLDDVAGDDPRFADWLSAKSINKTWGAAFHVIDILPNAMKGFDNVEVDNGLNHMCRIAMLEKEHKFAIINNVSATQKNHVVPAYFAYKMMAEHMSDRLVYSEYRDATEEIVKQKVGVHATTNMARDKLYVLLTNKTPYDYPSLDLYISGFEIDYDVPMTAWRCVPWEDGYFYPKMVSDMNFFNEAPPPAAVGAGYSYRKSIMEDMLEPFPSITSTVTSPEVSYHLLRHSFVVLEFQGINYVGPTATPLPSPSPGFTPTPITVTPLPTLDPTSTDTPIPSITPPPTWAPTPTPVDTSTPWNTYTAVATRTFTPVGTPPPDPTPAGNCPDGTYGVDFDRDINYGGTFEIGPPWLHWKHAGVTALDGTDSVGTGETSAALIPSGSEGAPGEVWGDYIESWLRLDYPRDAYTDLFVRFYAKVDTNSPSSLRLAVYDLGEIPTGSPPFPLLQDTLVLKPPLSEGLGFWKLYSGAELSGLNIGDYYFNEADPQQVVLIIRLYVQGKQPFQQYNIDDFEVIECLDSGYVPAAPTPTHTPAFTSLPTYTPTSIPKITDIPTAVPTWTDTPTPTNTATPTPSITPTSTASSTPTPEDTHTPTPTYTYTPSATPTGEYHTPTHTFTPVPSDTPTPTHTSTHTHTATHTATSTHTPTPTFTPTPDIRAVNLEIIFSMNNLPTIHAVKDIKVGVASAPGTQWADYHDIHDWASSTWGKYNTAYGTNPHGPHYLEVGRYYEIGVWMEGGLGRHVSLFCYDGRGSYSFTVNPLLGDVDKTGGNCILNAWDQQAIEDPPHYGKQYPHADYNNFYDLNCDGWVNSGDVTKLWDNAYGTCGSGDCDPHVELIKCYQYVPWTDRCD